MSVLTVTLNPCVDKTVVIEGFECGGLNRVKKSSSVLAGKGINVSRVLEMSGADVFATGFMGEFAAEGMPCGEFVKINDSVRTNIKICDELSGITTEINEPGFTVGNAELEKFKALFDVLLKDANVIVISGSMPKGVSPNFYAELCENAKKLNKKVILDCAGTSFAEGITSAPYAVKPNLTELEEYFGKINSEEKLKEAVKRVADFGVSLVAVSMGADGAVFYGDGQFVRVKPFSVDVKSTVGAGDSMVAAIAFGIENGYDLSHIATLSTAMGTLTTSLEATTFSTVQEAEKLRGGVYSENF